MTELDNLSKKMLELWEKGYSNSQIGSILGVTKNVVAGKIFRLRMKGYAGSLRRKAAVVKEKEAPKIKNRKIIREINAGKREKPVVQEFVAKKQERKSYETELLNLKHWSCRYIVYTGPRFPTLYCGKPKARGAYCGPHADMCYIKPESRKRGERKSFTFKYDPPTKPAYPTEDA